MKNNKGFAVTGILYAILVLFLFLILLILNSFQVRKVLFDKQKDTVLEKIGDNIGVILEQKFVYNSEQELQEFITPKNGKYKIEVWGAGTTSGYVSGIFTLKQGDRLYIEIKDIDDSDNSSSIRLDPIKRNTTILKAYGSNGSTDNFVYDKTYTDINGRINDIYFESTEDSVKTTANGVYAKSVEDGYVRISYNG